MTVARKHIPEAVVWDQQAILAAIARLSSQLTQLNNLTGTPQSDAKGVVTRNVRDFEIIEALDRNTEVLERIQQQLSFITDVNLNLGE